MKAVREFWWDQSGATSIEYSIMASCIAVAVVVAVNALGSAVKGNYTSSPPGEALSRIPTITRQPSAQLLQRLVAAGPAHE